jgi:glutamyl-tRNA reductase
LSNVSSIEYFHVIGTSFQKADTQTRSRFAIAQAGACTLLAKAKAFGFSDFIVLSTCNRSEVYACAPLSVVKEFLCRNWVTQQEDFDDYFYLWSGTDAVSHLFRVVAGLDSQILGDYEIVNQVKQATAQARQYQLVGTLTDRITSLAFQASKKVKSHTGLSRGKYSVSYAAAELLSHENKDNLFKHILLVGTGTFGSAVGQNLRHYFPTIKIAVTNRTAEKAGKLAEKIEATVTPFNTFHQQLHQFDAVITTVGLDHYLIDIKHIQHEGSIVFIDLSVPQAVNPEVKTIQGIKLFAVDEVSAFHNKMLGLRQLEIPGAEKIIDLFVDQLMTWYRVYHHRHLILGYKEKIQNLTYNHDPEAWHAPARDKKVEQAFSNIIQQIRSNGYAGCMMIEAMNNLIPSDQ